MLSSFYTYENEDQINIDLKCPICLDPFQSPFCDAHCGHTFCFQCIKTWLRKKQSCPICRRYFTKFEPITDKRQRNELDNLLVQCVLCNETNIKRGNFNDHVKHRCSKRIVIDQENEESLGERLNFEYFLRRINESTENRRRHRQYYERYNFYSLPIWIIIMSGAHIFFYLSVLIPIAAILYITDAIMCPILHVISWLIHFIKLRL